MDRQTDPGRLRHRRVAPLRVPPGLAEDVRAGLLRPPRSLPPKYFYDDHGSRLFEAICRTPEYYPTRAEAALLADTAERIVERVLPGHIIELGSGNSRKTRHLIGACDRIGIAPCYWPFEVSSGIMLDAARALIADYPWLTVEALSGDYTAGLDNLPLAEDGEPRLFVFLGGTIGNFAPAAAGAFIAEIAALMGPRDALLIGFDRIKDRATLEAAYDDAAGHTAAFNKNLLAVLNRELDGDIPLDAYRHRAVYDAEAERIEMHLVAERDHKVRLAALDAGFTMAAGEFILTEISHKFSPASITALLAGAGLTVSAHFEKDAGSYSLVLARRRA